MTQHHRSIGESRLERGRPALAEIDGHAGEAVVASLADFAPDFATDLMAVYAGFPAALNGLFVAKEVFARRFETGSKGAA